ncbi:hypothetical protein WJX73_006078 [Symbiochloris irregularis]|uniref:Trafficking protein particle complex subunit 13 n=1 Tax=Symbiochloris irregularis TaxID=706552 RepID=A0AAW1NLV3_9CHLO
MLKLPQSFGVIYLGEAFCTYISVSNTSSEPVTNIVIKAELQTDRQKVTLKDGTKTPLPSLGPGEREDFIVSHDVKEVGPHTLVCSTSYTAPDGEQKYVPQYFKFASHNPFSVRTKSRTVAAETGAPQVLMEACVENATKGTLFLEYVRFDAGTGLSATRVAPPTAVGQSAGRHRSPAGAAVSSYVAGLQLLDPGGAVNTLYRVQRLGPGTAEHAAAQVTIVGGNSTALGRLEIKWRGMLGDMGRLQTQQITAPVLLAKDVELVMTAVEKEVQAEVPFNITLAVRRSNDASSTVNSGQYTVVCGPSSAPGETLAEGAAREQRDGQGNVVVLSQTPDVVDLSEAAEASVQVTLLPLRTGVQHLPLLRLQDVQRHVTFDAVESTVMVHPCAS